LSELAPPNFAQRLKRYFEDVDKQGSEAGKAFLFLEFVRDIFKQIDMDYLERLYPQIEKHIKLQSKTLVVRSNICCKFKFY